MNSKSASSESEKTGDVEQNTLPPATDDERPCPRNEVDWDSPNDPKNPRNWPAWRRAMHVGVVTCVVFST